MKMDPSPAGNPGAQTNRALGGPEDRQSAVAAFERWQRERVTSPSDQALQGLLGERRPSPKNTDLQS
jgi:hypothetical protein